MERWPASFRQLESSVDAAALLPSLARLRAPSRAAESRSGPASPMSSRTRSGCDARRVRAEPLSSPDPADSSSSNTVPRQAQFTSHTAWTTPGGWLSCMPVSRGGNRSGPKRLSVLPARSVQDWSSRRGRTRIRRSDGHAAGGRHWKLVPGAGFEPARPKPADFKSAASTWFRHPGGLEFRGGIAPARMEAEVGIEPAYTALQAAA